MNLQSSGTVQRTLRSVGGTVPRTQAQADDLHAILDRRLDQALEDTFPASDPITIY